MATTIQLTRSTSRGSDFELAYASPIILEAKGADRESLERHNSKRHRPRGLSDEAGKLSNDGRNRRSRGSSDDEGKVTEDGFSNEDLRVGGPYLCSIPLTTTVIPQTDPLSSLFVRMSSNGQDLGDRIDSILDDRNIQLYSSWERSQSMEPFLRQSKFNPEPHPIPTLVITATRQVVDDTWLQAAREIHFLLREENLGHVSVEIQDPQADQPPISSPIHKDDKIYPQWDSVLGRILESIDLQEILTIGCYRRGRSSDITENAPTVLVIVDVNSQKSWKPTRDSIARILSGFRLPMVAVEIVKDRINLLRREEGFKSEILRDQAVPGGPISALKRKDASGTLGGFIELQSPTDGVWLRFGLTCFHVIDLYDRDVVGSQDLAAIKNWRRDGIPMYEYKKSPREFAVLARNLKISHPSLLAKQEQDDLSRGMIDGMKRSSTYQRALMLGQEGLFDELSKRQKDIFQSMQQTITESEADLQSAAKFFEKSENVLGTVTAGSGLRTIERYTLGGKGYPTGVDWALISIDNRWSISNRLDDKTGLWVLASPEDFQGLEKGSDENRLLEFQGYRSRRQQALYNGLKVAKVRTKIIKGKEERVKSLEYSICAYKGDPPALLGDSGSLLLSSMGKVVVGMIYAGLEHNKIAFFTRIDDLCDDVLKQTGAKGFRMYDG